MVQYKKSECGRSMIEMMGYLAVLMSVIIAIGRIVNSAFDNHRYSTATVQLTELATSIVKSAAIDVDYGTILEDINTKNDPNHVVPSSFRKAGSDIFHVFGGKVTIDRSEFSVCNGVMKEGSCEGTVESNRKDQFSISFYGLNKKQCVELAIKDWRSNQYVDLYAIDVNGTTWLWQAYDDSASSIEEDACSGTTCAFPVKRVYLTGTGGEDTAVCHENNNKITWTFN